MYFFICFIKQHSNHIYEEKDILQNTRKNLINKLMPKDDLQRQYSSCCEVADEAQSVTVIESSVKPLSYLYLYLLWLLVEHSVIVWNSILIRYLTLKIRIRTFSKILLLIFWCISACVSEIRVFSIVCICAVFYFMQNCTLCPWHCMSSHHFVYICWQQCIFFSFCFSSHWLVTYIYEI